MQASRRWVGMELRASFMHTRKYQVEICMQISDLLKDSAVIDPDCQLDGN